MTRSLQLGARRWVIKIGSSLVTADGSGLDRVAIAGWAQQMAALAHAGHELVLVSSGAVAEGVVRLGWSGRPRELHNLQAAAAVGQMGLVQAWEAEFQRYDRHTAQVLFTHDELSHRRRYLNARSTLRTLLELGVVSVVNENDTVSTNEIRLGDNDTLGALAANLIEADMLVILTDQDGLFDADPRHNPQAKLISDAAAHDRRLLGMAGAGAGELGRGGMRTKVLAAQRAARSGAATLIANGREPDVLARIAAGEALGTLLSTEREPLAARKQWIASHLQLRGSLTLDAGAVQMLQESGSSLLPVGVRGADGDFSRGEVVSIRDPAGAEIGRGLVNYPIDEARKIIGRPSGEIADVLGYVNEDELVHRDDMVLF